jgi:hypothetical protein
MSQRFEKGSGQFAGAVMLAALFAGVVCIATSGHANEAKLTTAFVDRMHKGDRLPLPSNLGNYKTTKGPTIVPSGCDPAFSPFADPERSRIFGRCIT